jgi:hypothetical protein
MRIVLFCENKYAVDILLPIQEEADKEGNNQVIWYVHKAKIPDFPLKEKVKWSNSMQEIYDFSPEAIFCPGNILPYYLPGVKVQVFHGYAGEKKGHWVIRHYFDTYFTQGPHFTKGFKVLAAKHGNFEVLETGWPRQDWVMNHLHDFDEEKARILEESGRKQIVLYAPTFSPSLTSLPVMKQALVELTEKRDVVVMIKLHPLTRPEWVEEYRALAQENRYIMWTDDFSVAKYQLMADVMISDTSSTIYEFLLKDKPVITYRASAKNIYWKDIQETGMLCNAFDEVQNDEKYINLRKWIIENYDPYTDGKVAHRMLEGARDYIRRHGVPKKRKVNLWRKYTGIKTFGRIKKS